MRRRSASKATDEAGRRGRTGTVAIPFVSVADDWGHERAPIAGVAAGSSMCP
jgi:hypothetical protein